jgi:biopolymer transport protein ExbD
MRRRRRVPGADDAAEVAMSPLIDCVFLLLIFFLVTTIIKRKDKQIEIEMPDSTASVSADVHYDVLRIGLDQDGKHQRAVGKDREGRQKWAPIEDLALFLKTEVERQGRDILSKPIQVSADRLTPFQKAIDTLDLLKLQGFTSVSLKTRGRVD